MDLFSLVDTDILRKVISQLMPSTCLLYPTTTFKTVFNCISEEVKAIVNHSLFTGTLPTAIKKAIMKPLLKKSHLDSSAFSNFRPISDLPLLNNILEKLVFKRQNNLFKSQHRRQTALCPCNLGFKCCIWFRTYLTGQQCVTLGEHNAE